MTACHVPAGWFTFETQRIDDRAQLRTELSQRQALIAGPIVVTGVQLSLGGLTRRIRLQHRAQEMHFPGIERYSRPNRYPGRYPVQFFWLTLLPKHWRSRQDLNLRPSA